eukprot:TRINITY_DN64984_c0_g1_i1.p2 TRINITY_DN64984_c0_g1~~TRINITY_DN64984_c0_g1_i1.p2  ORF type:complete len:115 (+),score=2.83 TRINITY_DN64984_c0_g1_i1:162-506(+)
MICLPGNFFDALNKASLADFKRESLHLIEIITWLISILATFPYGFPKAPLIPVWSLSAPAQESILLILSTWKGCILVLIWKPSFLDILFKTLLAATLPASIASEEICSNSLEIK